VRIIIYGLNFTPEPVGIGKYTGEMVQWLVAHGHQIKVVCAPPYYPDWRVADGHSRWRYRRESIHGAEVLRCPLWVPRKVTGLTRILHLLSFTLSSAIPLLGQRHWRPDVIVVIEPPLFGAVPALLAGKLAGARTWLHVQDFEVDAAFDLGLLKSAWLHRLACRAECALMRRFDRVSTISEKMLERALTKTQGQTPCLLFPNWVDTKRIFPLQQPSPYREELGLPRNAIVLLYSGSIGEKQGLEFILEAARRLIDQPAYHFIMAGSGAAYERLRAQAADIQNMRWLPLQPAERLNDFLNLADIHLLPQKADAADRVMPSKLTGMLASGRAVLATAAPDTQVATVLAHAGIVVEPDDIDAFVAAIQQLRADPQLRRTLGAAGRTYAAQILEHDNVLAGFEQELQRMLQPPAEHADNALPQTDDLPASADERLLAVLGRLLQDLPAPDIAEIEAHCRARVAHLCAIHGVEALLYAALERKRNPSEPADSLCAELKPAVHRAAARELARQAAVRAILDRFAAAGIPVLVLKGTALAYTYYPQPYLRSRGDLDLLIPEHRQADADAVFTTAGYAPQHQLREAGSFQLTYYPPASAVGADAIDLHEKLNDHRIFTPLLAFEQLFADSIPIPALGPHARSPSPVHMMLHACMHRAANFTTVYRAAGESVIEPNRLIWLYDIHLLANAFTRQEWTRLADFAEQHAIRQVCWDALQATASAFRKSIPADVAKRLGTAETKEPSAAYLRTGLANKLLTDIKAEPNFRARWRLAAEYALPDAGFIRRKYDQRAPLSALYALHIARGIARLTHLRRL
jgi:colanic acid biosynthesis glycosyl transferase WcaI